MLQKLFSVLLFTALFLVVILLHNTLGLYKRKLSDDISLMLMSLIFMCGFEIIWNECYGVKELGTFGYIGACGYVIAFVAFGTFFNRFFLKSFKLLPESRWKQIVFYIVPNFVILLTCITTPWTHLIIWVDSEGIINEMILFRTLFYGILLVYLFTSLIPAVYYVITDRKNKRSVNTMAKSLIVFAVTGPLFFLFQYLIVGEEGNDYLALSLSCALAMVYLTNTINTYLLLENQEKVNAAENDLRIAAKIQEDALPPSAPEFEDHTEVELRASMNTLREVGGDFYDYFVLDEHRLCIVIADVSGKGTPAALFMMTVKTMIKDYVLINKNTADTFDAVNNLLCENNDEGMFATAWIGILDMDTGALSFTNAGHNYPLLKRHGKPCEVLKVKHGLFLAGMEDTVYGQDELRLETGDRLFLYTDGVTEAHNPEKRLYGYERLMGVLDKCGERNGEEVLSAVLKDVEAFSDGEPQFDDITMMILTIGKKEM